MNLTLHLTEDCNMACAYCPNEKSRAVMSEEVAFAACRLAFSKGEKAGLCFFGGEPLLQKELLISCLDYCEQLSRETGKHIDYRMTTNGTLLDGEIISRMKKAGAVIGVSFEGTAQDICRKFKDGGGTFDTVSENTRLLLKSLPDSYAMMTIAPQAVSGYAEAVRFLYSHGFRRITATIAYGKYVHWTDEAMLELEKQLREIAGFYRGVFLRGERLYFSPFDAKIRDCINDFNPDERCHLGYRQMPVDINGKIYPCTQFIGDPDYCLGNVFDGVDEGKQRELASRASTPAECLECELKMRCTNSCGCMNRLETGNENRVSPLQCTYERMLIGIADELAERLFDEQRKDFVRKFAKRS